METLRLFFLFDKIHSNPIEKHRKGCECDYLHRVKP